MARAWQALAAMAAAAFLTGCATVPASSSLTPVPTPRSTGYQPDNCADEYGSDYFGDGVVLDDWVMPGEFPAAAISWSGLAIDCATFLTPDGGDESSEYSVLEFSELTTQEYENLSGLFTMLGYRMDTDNVPHNKLTLDAEEAGGGESGADPAAGDDPAAGESTSAEDWSRVFVRTDGDLRYTIELYYAHDEDLPRGTPAPLTLYFSER